MHAVFAPWVRGTTVYVLQHFCLTVIVGVFFCGVVLKLDGVDASSVEYSALSAGVISLVVLALAGATAALIVETARRCRSRSAATVSNAVKSSSLPRVASLGGGAGAGDGEESGAGVRLQRSSMVLLRQSSSRPLIQTASQRSDAVAMLEAPPVVDEQALLQSQ
jgi:hypothetical protein